MRIGLIALIPLLACCGAEPDQAAIDTARTFVAAAHDDPAAACALLAPRAAEHYRQSTVECPDALRDVGDPGEIHEAEQWGDSVIVYVGPTTLYLGWFGDGWRVTGAGCVPTSDDAPKRCSVGGP